MNLELASLVITNTISNVFIDLHMQKYFYLNIFWMVLDARMQRHIKSVKCITNLIQIPSKS